MAGFSELWPLGGVGPWSGSTFMMAPKDGANLVILDGASPRELAYDHQKFDIVKVTNDDKLKVTKKLNAEVVAHLAPALAALKKDSHLLAVTKQRGTEDAITIGKGGAVALKVGLFPPRRYSLAFKFLQHDAKTRPSKWDPTHAAGWLPTLNATYGPQSNITFEMAEKADFFTVSTALPQPIGNQAFASHIMAHKSKVTTEKSKPPVLTVFIVGKWKDDGDHPNGTFFPNDNVTVLTDEPMHPKLDAATDPLVLTLAHEVAHFVLHHRGFKKAEHHHGRDRILMSSGIQSARFDKQLMLNLNPY
jgi:hypothetical protein